MMTKEERIAKLELQIRKIKNENNHSVANIQIGYDRIKKESIYKDVDLSHALNINESKSDDWVDIIYHFDNNRENENLSNFLNLFCGQNKEFLLDIAGLNIGSERLLDIKKDTKREDDFIFCNGDTPVFTLSPYDYDNFTFKQGCLGDKENYHQILYIGEYIYLLF